MSSIYRIGFLSDLHLTGHGRGDAWGARSPDPRLDQGPPLDVLAGIDLVLLAGDVAPARAEASRGCPGVLDYASALATALDCRVRVVPGNHEYYGVLDMQTARTAMLECGDDRARVLETTEEILDLPGGGRLRLLGLTLWTDYAVLEPFGATVRWAMDQAEMRMNDHRLIGIDGVKRFRPTDALAFHMSGVAWLEERLAEPFEGPSVIVAHHAPLLATQNPKYRRDALAPAFCSALDGLVARAAAAGVVAFVHGHNHWNRAPIGLDGLRVVSAQWGYRHETPYIRWKGPGLLELRRRRSGRWELEAVRWPGAGPRIAATRREP